MTDGWYVYRHGQQTGPFSWEHMVDEAINQNIAYDDMVWSPESSSWGTAGSIQSLFPGFLQTAPIAPHLTPTASSSMKLLKIGVITLAGLAVIVTVILAGVSLMKADEPTGEIAYRGGTYTGELVDSLPHGSGSWNHPDGSEYSGQWQDGLMHGSGKLLSNTGNVYEGEMRVDQPHGTGTMNYPDGSVYSGSWEAGLRSGYGTLTLTAGNEEVVGRLITGAATYEGQFNNDYFNGAGTLITEHGVLFEGEFLDGGIVNGKATFPADAEHNGSEYNGYFENYLPHGQGVWIINLDSETIIRNEGFFAEGDLHGQGRRIIETGVATGFYWEGEFQNGDLVKGTIYFADTERLYQGDVLNNMAHGFGTAVYPDGTVETGRWSEGLYLGP